MSDSKLADLAVPVVSLLIAFLSYASQGLFTYIKPGPLTRSEQWVFNVMVGCIWVSYLRAVLVNPGEVPPDWDSDEVVDGEYDSLIRQRFCRKCQAPKPARSHHCKICKRCIPKMDHHCPWTANCVSHFTFPHFMRFLFYAVASMTYLERFLYDRAAVIWRNRHLRYDLGPTARQMILLFVLIIVNSLTLFLVSITFFRTFYNLACNVTTIESWEIERHEQLLKRARVFGGVLDGPDGVKVRIVKQEFPYDIGIWRNVCQSMGTSNVLAWFWPFSRTPRNDGLVFETNGFEDPGTSWPPPDPDRLPRTQRSLANSDAFTFQNSTLSAREEIEAFRRRQQEDFARRNGTSRPPRRKAFHQRYESYSSQQMSDEAVDEDPGSASGEEGWQDSGGNRLKDYGVDEDIEFYDEDDVPLAELLRRRKDMQSSR